MLSQLIKNIKKGNIIGRCVVCGIETKEGLHISVSENFSGWGYFYDGECFCPYCAALFADQNFRKRCWVATKNEIKFMKKAEILKYLLDLPEPPFFIYVTKGGQRQGWLSAMKYVNYSRKQFFVSCDWIEQPIWMTSIDVAKMHKVIQELRGKKLPKTIISSADFGIYWTQKSMKEGWYKLIKYAIKQKGNPAWEVMLYVES